MDFYYIKFWTLGGAGETTESSGALMVPTGAAPACSGPRPIVLYAHGTNPDKTLNIADITNTSNTEGVLIAAMFAAQGYIVVAPNYAGYDISTLGYHPFLNAEQQSGEMIDILTAARTALPKTLSSATSDSGKLFITGYSEGGHVAMATQRAIEASGAVVTGAAPMSGPYALEAFGDAIFFGTRRSRLDGILAPAQHQLPEGLRQYLQHARRPVLGDLCERHRNAAAERDAHRYDFLDRLAAGDRAVRQHHAGRARPDPALTAFLSVPGSASYPVPPSAQTPLFAAGFGSPYLINNSYRVSYALDAVTNPDGGESFFARAGAPLAATAPAQTLRQAFYKNDLRNGGIGQPEFADPAVRRRRGSHGVLPVNTGTMAAFWAPLVQAGLITVLDVNGTPGGPFAAVQAGFQESQAAQLAYYESPAGGGLSPAAAAQLIVEGYHTSVAPFCAAAARAFFSEL